MDASQLSEILKDFLTAEQAASRLKIGIRAVQTACDRGQLPGAILIGREWRIPALAVVVRLKKHGKGQIPQAVRANPRRKSNSTNELKIPKKIAKSGR